MADTTFSVLNRGDLPELTAIQRVAQINRTLPIIDVLTDKLSEETVDNLIKDRVKAATHFFDGLKTLKNLFDVIVAAATPILPPQISGAVALPNGAKGAELSVTADWTPAPGTPT